MKILVLSDLHIYFWHSQWELSNYKKQLHQLLDNNKFDCVVISGDILESDFMSSNNDPYKFLHSLFENDYPIICCLGNHEFAYHSIDKVLKYYKHFTNRYNIHYLDVEGKFTFNNINFVGNVLWYDNSLASNRYCKPDYVIDSWLDSKIKDFVPSQECNVCKKQILCNIDKNLDNILVTHMVPHYKMNWFTLYQTDSYYNQYSGCKDFLSELSNVKWSICGHTHKRIMDTINNINCVNVGNDYLTNHMDIKYFIINTENDKNEELN